MSLVKNKCFKFKILITNWFLLLFFVFLKMTTIASVFDQNEQAESMKNIINASPEVVMFSLDIFHEMTWMDFESKGFDGAVRSIAYNNNMTVSFSYRESEKASFNHMHPKNHDISKYFEAQDIDVNQLRIDLIQRVFSYLTSFQRLELPNDGKSSKQLQIKNGVELSQGKFSNVISGQLTKLEFRKNRSIEGRAKIIVRFTPVYAKNTRIPNDYRDKENTIRITIYDHKISAISVTKSGVKSAVPKDQHSEFFNLFLQKYSLEFSNEIQTRRCSFLFM